MDSPQIKHIEIQIKAIKFLWIILNMIIKYNTINWNLKEYMEHWTYH